jgi:hypothetical protein
MLDRQEIACIVHAGRHPGGIEFYHDGWKRVDPDEAGQLLWDWNREAACRRYDIAAGDVESLPGVNGEDYVYLHTRPLVADSARYLVGLELIEKLKYQCQGYTGWQNHDGASLTEAIQKRCITLLTAPVPPRCECGGFGGLHVAGCEVRERGLGGPQEPTEEGL